MKGKFGIHANILAVSEERRSGDGAEVGAVADEFEIESFLHLLVRRHQLFTRQLNIVGGRLLRNPFLVLLSDIVADEGFALVHEGTLVLDTTGDGDNLSVGIVLVPFEDFVVVLNVVCRFLGSSPDSGFSVFTRRKSPLEIFEWCFVAVLTEEFERLL